MKGKAMDIIICEHPVHWIAVTWRVAGMEGKYKIEKPVAQCRNCKSFLEPSNKHGMIAIDIAMAGVTIEYMRTNGEKFNHGQGVTK